MGSPRRTLLQLYKCAVPGYPPLPSWGVCAPLRLEPYPKVSPWGMTDVGGQPPDAKPVF